MDLVSQEQEKGLMLQGSYFDYEAMLAGRLGASSIAMYKRDVKAYEKFCKSNDLNMLNPQTLALWRDSLVLSGNKSPNTINRMMSAVKRIVKEASLREMIDPGLRIQFNDIPGVTIKAMKSKLKKNARTRISPETMRALCEYPDADTLIGQRDRAMLATLASSGVRASELASLTREQIVQQDQGYILRVCGKTDTEYRDANLSIEAYLLIEEWLAARPFECEYVFTGFTTRAAKPTDAPLSEAGVWWVIKKYARKYGIKNVKPHDFRRFVGTQLAKKDIRKAQLALGHKSIEVTARHYVLDELEVGQTDNLY